MALVLELESSSMRITQLKGEDVVLRDEHLVVDGEMTLRINGQPMDFHFGDDLLKKTSRKDLIVRTLDLVDAIRISISNRGYGRYVWEKVDPPVGLNRITLKTYRIRGFDEEILEGVRLDGTLPDEFKETFAGLAQSRTIAVNDPFFAKYPLHFE